MTEEKKISEYLEVLSSKAPVPGGGGASALAGALGNALGQMVVNLTVGKKKYAEFEDHIKGVHEKSAHLQDQLLEAIDKDTEAFNVVSAVFDLPKETEEEKAARREAMQKALKHATVSPFSMMELIVEALETTKEAVGKSNTNAASDLGVAALNLKAGLQGAWLNVLINISGIKDQDFVQEYHGKGLKLLQTGSELADNIYQSILESLS